MMILLVEDDVSMQTALQRALSRRGLAVQVCGDGVQALPLWRELAPDLVILDLTLPGQDGLQLLAQAREHGLSTPVLILTARGTVGDKVLGLNTGADDYLPKPFDLDELEARVRALLRRPGPDSNERSSAPTAAAVSLGNLRLDPVNGAIYLRDAILELTPRELALLQALLLKAGRAISKERLFELVFPDAPDVQYEAIEVVVYRLRKKLAHSQVELVTLRGLGYLLKQTP